MDSIMIHSVERIKLSSDISYEDNGEVRYHSVKLKIHKNGRAIYDITLFGDDPIKIDLINEEMV